MRKSRSCIGLLSIFIVRGTILRIAEIWKEIIIEKKEFKRRMSREGCKKREIEIKYSASKGDSKSDGEQINMAIYRRVSK